MKRVIELLEAFQPITGTQRVLREQILQFVRANPENCLNRSNLTAHLTASAWIVDKITNRKALLVHHRKLNKWLQPGGHADGEEDLLRVALKEVEEETGLLINNPEPNIFDLDVHLIPLHGEVPPHLHLDVRFLFQGDPSSPIAVSAESRDVRWFSFEEIRNLDTDQSVLRLLEQSEKMLPQRTPQ